MSAIDIAVLVIGGLAGLFVGALVLVNLWNLDTGSVPTSVGASEEE